MSQSFSRGGRGGGAEEKVTHKKKAYMMGECVPVDEELPVRRLHQNRHVITGTDGLCQNNNESIMIYIKATSSLE